MHAVHFSRVRKVALRLGEEDNRGPKVAIELVSTCYRLSIDEDSGSLQALALILEKKPSIRTALFNDMFTMRRVPEIHPSLCAFSRAFQAAEALTVLDLRSVFHGYGR